jgi:hypothetical protein
MGSKLHLPPKLLHFTDDQDLSRKLWFHHQFGDGQPVVIDLSKLDFSDNIRLERLQTFKNLRTALRTFPDHPKNIVLLRKFISKLVPNSQVKIDHGLTVVNLHQNIQDVVAYHASKASAKFLAFGEVSFDVTNIQLVYHPKTKSIIVYAHITAASGNQNHNLTIPYELLDRFDFNRGKRGIPIKQGVTAIREMKAGTSFNIWVPKGAQSPLEREIS